MAKPNLPTLDAGVHAAYLLAHSYAASYLQRMLISQTAPGSAEVRVARKGGQDGRGGGGGWCSWDGSSSHKCLERKSMIRVARK